MTIKLGVRLCGLKPELLLGLVVANSVFDRFKQPLTITSVTGTGHSRASLHYQGQAVDLRLPPPELQMAIVQSLSDALGEAFDVVEELDHIHLEWQPK